MSLSLPKNDLQHIWQQAKNCQSALNNSRIFITGGTGFFGHWLLESIAYANIFLNAQIKVMILTRDLNVFLKKSPHFAKLNWLHFLEGDVQHFTFPANTFTHVIHAATEASAALNQQNASLMFDTIVEGTRHTLEFARYARAKHFLLISSGAVYGRQPPALDKIHESYSGIADPLNDQSFYAIGKRTAENVALLFSQHFALRVTIARCFAFVGPYLPLTIHYAIGNFIANALNHEPIHIAGDGTPYRSYLYAADLMVWLWHILCFGESGKAYNVGSDQAITISELANLVAKIANTYSIDLKVIRAKEPNPLILPERYIPDTERARDELKLQQWITLSEAIRKTMDWNLSASNTVPTIDDSPCRVSIV